MQPNQDFLLQWAYDSDDVPYISDNPWLIVWINNAPHGRFAGGGGSTLQLYVAASSSFLF